MGLWMKNGQGNIFLNGGKKDEDIWFLMLSTMMQNPVTWEKLDAAGVDFTYLGELGALRAFMSRRAT